MKKTFLAFATLICLSVNAQERGYVPQSGDKDMDKALTDINTEANADIETFKSEMETTLSLPKQKSEVLLSTMKPADVYMVAQTAQTIGKPIDEVASAYEKNKDKGWGVTAKELGIKPGSKEFKALKGKVKDKGKKAKAKSSEKAKKNDKEKSDEKTKGKSEDKAKNKK
jgi:hypothetical protein